MQTSHLFSKNDFSFLTNCHPISITLLFAKVFGGPSLKQLVEHLEKHALFNRKQFDCQSRKLSTEFMLHFIAKRIGNMIR